MVLLPEPDSPTRPSVSPRCDRERHVVDRAHRPVACCRSSVFRLRTSISGASTVSSCGLTSSAAATQHAARLSRLAGVDERRHGLRGRRRAPGRSAARRRSRAAARAGSRPGRGSRTGASAAAGPAARALPGRQASRPCVYGCAGAREQRPHRRAFDDAAGVHHHHVVGVVRDDAEVVGDEQDAHAGLGLQAAASARGSAPGSSRRARWSARRRSAASGRRPSPARSSRAGACRPRAGAGTRRGAARRPASPPARACAAPAARAAPRSRPLCRRSDSAICSPMLNTGFRLVIGSWKIIATSLPRSARMRGSGSASRSSRSPARSTNQASPLTRVAALRGKRRISVRLVTDLPEPDSPTMRRGLAGADREADVGDGVDPAFVGRERRAEVADFEAVHRHRFTSTCAGADRAGRGCRRRAAAARAR